MERGYSGVKMPGRRTGAPFAKDAQGDRQPLAGFESVVLSVRRVGHMTGQFGRVTSVV